MVEIILSALVGFGVVVALTLLPAVLVASLLRIFVRPCDRRSEAHASGARRPLTSPVASVPAIGRLLRLVVRLGAQEPARSAAAAGGSSSGGRNVS